MVDTPPDQVRTHRKDKERLECSVGLSRRARGHRRRPSGLSRADDEERTAETARATIRTVSPLGLLAEEIDLTGTEGIYRGNYPQAFSHIGLVNSALYLGRLRNPEKPGPDPVGLWLGEGPAIPD